MARFDPDLSGRFLGNDMPIPGLFCFFRLGATLRRPCRAVSDCRHARARFALPAALIVLGGSIEEGMRAAGDYMGLGAAIGEPQILTQEVEKACAGH